MNAPYWVMIGMALGFTLLGIFAINEAGNVLFAVHEPEKPGYIVEGVTNTETAEAEEDGAAEEAVLPDFGTVLASADVAAGEKVAARCAQCHTWTQGGENKIGPNLWGIMGAKHAHLPNFNYSPAMAAIQEPWDYANMYKFLEKPAAAIPGTKMAFAGIRRSDDRIALLAYMRTWADTPFPLPAPALTPPAASEAVPQPGEEGQTPQPPAPAENPPVPQPAQGQ